MMIEAKITCLCNQISFKDLGLSMKKGEVSWISEKEAKSSSDLRRFSLLGAVKLEYLERYRKQVRPGNSPPLRQRVPTVPVRKGNSELEGRVKYLEDSVGELKEIITDMYGNIMEAFDRQEKSLSSLERDSSPIKQILVEKQPISPTLRVAVEDEIEVEEVFIPSNLVLDAELGVVPKEETSKVDGLDESAKLLKSMKKKKAAGRRR